MSKVVEVATALRDIDVANGRSPPTVKVGAFLPAARVAIRAMMTPTKAMLKAACKAMSPDHRPEGYVSVKVKHEIRYRAMMSAAFDEPLGPRWVHPRNARGYENSMDDLRTGTEEGKPMSEHTPTPFLPCLPMTATKNSWQYTTIRDANSMAIARLDLEDWSVTEDNQDAFEKLQAQMAEYIVRAVNAQADLVQALERIEGQAVCDPMAGESEVRRMLAYCRELATAALAKAKTP